MRANRIAAEKHCVLRLRVFASERRGLTVSGLALGKKITQTLMLFCCRADLAVSCCGTKADDERQRKAAQNARESLVRKMAKGRYRARKTTQRQAQVPKAPLFCSATKVHTRQRARGGAIRMPKEKTPLTLRTGWISVL